MKTENERGEELALLLLNVKYKDWSFKIGLMGGGHYIQCVLPEINPATNKPWTG